ncbi:MAG: radical SAM protein [Planctomycetota bacterium]
MYPMNPSAIYATEAVYDDPRCVERMNRMLKAMGRDDVVKVDDAELSRLCLASGWHEPRLKGEIRPYVDPPILFNTMKWHTPEEKKARLEKHPALGLGDFPSGKLAGYIGWDWRGAPKEFKPGSNVRVCQPAHEIHTIAGCPFQCSYCAHLGDVIVINLNLEEFMARMDGWVDACPEQTLFKWDNATDAPCFEPEYGLTKLFVDYFAKKPDKYLLLYLGKCADIDYLLDFDHRGKTIVAFSITAKTQSTKIEKGAASTKRRIEALRKCQEAGYIVRVRFSPVFPVKNWRAENREMIRQLLSKVTPDVITLCVFGWMDVHKMKRAMDMSLMDPKMLEASEAAALEMRGKKFGPLPHEARKEIYRLLIDEVRAVNPDIPMSLCLESVEMWQEFGAELGMRPERYLCNCGPQCTPGTELYRELANVKSA